MSETQERQEASFEPMHQASPGELLRRERENQGLGLEEVAVQLNLRPAVVAGLEADRYDEVPIAAYRRGYLRAYARLMGIDEREVVDAYNSQHGHGDLERKVTPVHAANPPSRVGSWIFKLVTLLVILGLIALTLLWWQSRDGNDVLAGLGNGETVEMEAADGESADAATSDAAPAEASSAGESPAEASTDDDLPPLPAEDEELGLVEENAADTQTASTEEVAEGDTGSMIEPGTAPTIDEGDGAVEAEETSTTSEAQTAAEPAPDGRRLMFTFNEQSWTEVFDANDQRILVGLQAAGTEATAEGDPPFRLTIGNASGVELRYRGEEVDLGARAGGTNVARFTLGE
ncbi:cytoskeleton protein RodZ [Modicisalibacter ilicicola DSM 19980]|uniref:Cytoskeleton protein RodZ n=1 Tax=Modicisalibacter ilicicola DSM 19980 TaxID=1121942 RepID=A0A1M4T9L9_9GAMM|nr:RodZ domain-containing protein [Halomonas ilicicola]SHE41100.1 cytoskeleton protein RodZ [Halomonas ilicicola DSM 19980]